ncbi:MAG TPA: hypothetical protein VKV32_14405 [Stellaceae bacterium]|nr:hypothetical protein [Stellaceae bacterium]
MAPQAAGLCRRLGILAPDGEFTGKSRGLNQISGRGFRLCHEGVFCDSAAAMGTDLIGWAAAVILVATIGRQVYTQWRDGTTEGVSRWLFVGQVSASIGFVVYSWLLRDWVFVATNAVMLVTALIGQAIYLHNRHKSPDRAKNPYSARG